MAETDRPWALPGVLDLDEDADEETRARAVIQPLAGDSVGQFYAENEGVPRPTPWLDALAQASGTSPHEALVGTAPGIIAIGRVTVLGCTGIES